MTGVSISSPTHSNLSRSDFPSNGVGIGRRRVGLVGVLVLGYSYAPLVIPLRPTRGDALLETLQMKRTKTGKTG